MHEALETLLVLRCAARDGLVPATRVIDGLLDVRSACLHPAITKVVDTRLAALAGRSQLSRNQVDEVIAEVLRGLDEVEAEQLKATRTHRLPTRTRAGSR
jgi:hypothetical protein